MTIGAKDLLKRALTWVGLYPFASSLKHRLVTRKYRRIKTFEATVGSAEVRYDTQDEYSNDWFFPRYLDGRIHEPAVTQMLARLLDDASCFVDVGTNLGWYTCLAAKIMPQGRVYGFEMDALNFELLTRNIELNQCGNAEAHHVAVSDAPGLVRYRRPGDHPSAVFRIDTGMSRDDAAGTMVSVPAIALDDFLAERKAFPEVIKIDVEGAEMGVLNGMRSTLRDTRPALLLEIHPPDMSDFGSSVSDVLSLLFEHDYEVFEFANLRGEEADEGLSRLDRDSQLDSNTMLYARSGPYANTSVEPNSR